MTHQTTDTSGAAGADLDRREQHPSRHSQEFSGQSRILARRAPASTRPRIASLKSLHPLTSNMEARNIPVPAESLRTIAEAAALEARESREDGRSSTARGTERAVSEAFRSLDGRAGEFVSIDGSTVSTLCAAAAGQVDDFRHVDAAKVFLKQYGVWS